MTEGQRVSGACLCGAIRFAVRTPTSFCGHCHCTMCRRNHGAAYVTWFVVPREQFEFEAGEADLVRYQSSEHGARSFCRRCGSTLFCENDAHPGNVDIVLASMQGEIDRPPQLHIFFDDRASWVHVEDGLPRLGGENGMTPVEPEGA